MTDRKKIDRSRAKSMKDKGYSNREIARHLGVGETYIRSLLKGK